MKLPFFISLILFSNILFSYPKMKPDKATILVSYLNKLGLNVEKKTRILDLANANIENLNFDELLDFFTFLGKIEVKIKITSKKSCCGYLKADAAKAIALLWQMDQKQDHLSKIISIIPNDVWPILELGDDLNYDIILQAIKYNLIQNKNNQEKLIKNVSIITKNYIKFYPTNKKDKFHILISELVDWVRNESSNFKLKEQGILLGSILSGALLYVEELQDQKDKNIWIIDSLTNIAWAATSFIGAMPLASAVTSLAAGGLSLSVVLLDIIYKQLEHSDYHSVVKQIEGALELSLLNLSENFIPEKKIEILEMLAYMKASIHVSGLED